MRQSLPSANWSFAKGLITETTEFSFPEAAVTDAIDCIFDRTGFATRRKGFEFEDGYVLTNIPAIESGEVFTEFVWTSVAGDGTISFLVQQHGSTLFFYDISTSISISSNKLSFTIDLNSQVPATSPLLPAQYPCQYAVGRGNLIVVNRACEPFYVVYNISTLNITVTTIALKTRDFVGLDDGLTLNQRPTDSIAGLKVDNPEHFYNILNQGWYIGDALTQWDTARTDMPSNADAVPYYRSSPTDAFDNARVVAKSPGSTPAAKGHYILSVTSPDRSQAMIDDGITGVTIGVNTILISRSLGTIITLNSTGASTFAFNGVTNVPNTSCAALGAAGYIGKDYTSSPQRITNATVYGSNNIGYTASNPTINMTLYANQTAPANRTDGTILGTISFTDTADEHIGRNIISSDTSTYWNFVWVISDTSANMAEIEFETVDTLAAPGFPVVSTIERPKTVCFFAGRAFYAGIDALSLNNTIFFSQILQTDTKYGDCFQINDPTSEDVFNLLPSDGGTVVIPEMGSVRKLFTYQNALLIIASNGIWMVTGGSSGGFGGGFQANDYFVKKLSGVGSSSPLSIVDRRGVPLWWGEDGIYTVQYDPNFNSFNIVNITFKTIRSFFLDIPQANRKYAKGAYDSTLDISYWVYNSEESPTDNYTYDSVLVYSGISNAFYPWTIGDGVPNVRGIVGVQDAARNNLTTIKYTTTYISSGLEVLLYSEQINEDYLDWVIHGDNVDYNSIFISNYRVDGGGGRFFQGNYVWIFGEHQPNASCFMQGLFDFTVDPNSGKWSTPQQVMKFYDAKQGVNFKRLKIRGKGRGLQLRFYSETGKPFQIQGFSLYETINAQP